MIRVLICDDQDVVREGLRTILSAASGIEVVGTASDGAEAVEEVERSLPDVVLMDLKMPGVNGIHATRQIHARFPVVRVLVLTTYDADEWVVDAIRSGAAGYLLKDTPAEDLLAAIRGTAAGKTHMDPSVAGTLLDLIVTPTASTAPAAAASLTPRERQVLALLARGASNADIAKSLFLSEGTVRNHLSSIFAKLEVTDRTQAAIFALRHGLTDATE
jgi:DNA-binding NarL/FixJ family response regulator